MTCIIVFTFQNVPPSRATVLDDAGAMESYVWNVIYDIDRSLVWLATIRTQMENEEMDMIRAAELLHSGIDRIRQE